MANHKKGDTRPSTINNEMVLKLAVAMLQTEYNSTLTYTSRAPRSQKYQKNI